MIKTLWKETPVCSGSWCYAGPVGSLSSPPCLLWLQEGNKYSFCLSSAIVFPSDPQSLCYGALLQGSTSLLSCCEWFTMPNRDTKIIHCLRSTAWATISLQQLILQKGIVPLSGTSLVHLQEMKTTAILSWITQPLNPLTFKDWLRRIPLQGRASQHHSWWPNAIYYIVWVWKIHLLEAMSIFHHYSVN